MRYARTSTALLVIAGVLYLAGAGPAGATEPRQCVEYSPLGYCIEWEVPTPRGRGGGGGGGGSTKKVVCYWVTIRDPSGDPTIWSDFNLRRPPPGVTVVWQSWQCSDGSGVQNLRWVVLATPANLAAIARGRVLRSMPQ